MPKRPAAKVRARFRAAESRPKKASAPGDPRGALKSIPENRCSAINIPRRDRSEEGIGPRSPLQPPPRRPPRGREALPQGEAPLKAQQAGLPPSRSRGRAYAPGVLGVKDERRHSDYRLEGRAKLDVVHRVVARSPNVELA